MGVRRDWAGFAIWVVLIAVAHAIARSFVPAGAPDVGVGAPPLHGSWDPRLSVWAVPPIALAGLVVLAGPHVVGRLGWRPFLAVASIVAGVWAVLLAMTDGPAAVAAPLGGPYDHLASLPLVDGPRDLLRTFVDRIDLYTVHVRGHPPGFLVLAWWLDRLGAGGPGWAAGVVIAAGTVAVPAVLVAARRVTSDERAARRLAPFLVLAPLWIWVASSADALAMALGAWGVTMFVIAATGQGRTSDVAAVASGLLLGLALHCSYAVGPLGVIVVAVATDRRRIRPLIAGAIGAAAVTLASGALGFWWPLGLRATLEQYGDGIAALRPWSYYVVANLAAIAIAAGPAAAAGLAALRDRATWVLCGAALLAVVAADLTGFSKGEVERIWLPFAPWILLSAARLRPTRPWLGLQAATALAVQLLVRTPW